jgi:uncharacterized RDD family membrane protein YckC
VGVLGLGAASLAFIAAYRREHPAPPPVAPGDVPPPPVPMPYQAAEPPQYSQPSQPFQYSELAPPAGEPGAPPSEPPPIPPPAAPAAAATAPLRPSVLASFPRAEFRDRLAAFVLDVILVAIVENIVDINEGDLFLPFLLVYHIAFWTWKQTTVGGIITQIRLVRVDGAPLSFADALVRGLASIFSLAVLFIGALWILRDPERQSWHDKIAGTYVVKVPRNWPL